MRETHQTISVCVLTISTNLTSVLVFFGYILTTISEIGNSKHFVTPALGTSILSISISKCIHFKKSLRKSELQMCFFFITPVQSFSSRATFFGLVVFQSSGSRSFWSFSWIPPHELLRMSGRMKKMHTF